MAILTESGLRRLIKEELRKVLKEQESGFDILARQDNESRQKAFDAGKGPHPLETKKTTFSRFFSVLSSNPQSKELANKFYKDTRESLAREPKDSDPVEFSSNISTTSVKQFSYSVFVDSKPLYNFNIPYELGNTLASSL